MHTFYFKTNKWNHWLLALLLLALLIEFFRDIFGTGDFVGYINAGNNALNRLDIYGDYLNTWPPLFSLFSIPIAYIDNVNGVLSRTIWLLGTLVALFWIMRITVQLSTNKKLLLPFVLPQNEDQIAFTHLSVLIPFLIIFRYVLDNMANIQINIFMLAMALASLHLLLQNRHKLASFWLALSISLKVFTIFLIPFYLYKRKFKMVGLTLLWMAILGSMPLLYFGWEQGINYYHTFYTERASPFAMILHKNQSIFASFRALLVNESRGFDIYLNLLSLSVQQAKYLSYIIVGVIGLGVLYVFIKNKLEPKHALIIETYFVLTAIPILSPLAWKAYFIFLWPGYYWVYNQLWPNNKGNYKYLKALFYISLLLTIFSSELFVGGYISDIFEVYSAITLGTIILLLIFIILYNIKSARLGISAQ